MSGFETKAIPSGAAPSACAAPSSSVSYKLPESATATSCEAPNTLAESSSRALRQELEKKLAKLELDTASAQKNVETTKESLTEAQTGILNSRVTLLSGHQKALTEQLGNEQHYAKTLEAQTRGYNKTLDLLDQVQKNPNPELITQLERQLEKFPLADHNISRQHIANLQATNQTLAAVDETYRRQEVVVRTTRNVAIATGAAIATGGVLSGAYLAGTTATMGTVGTTATALATGTALGTTAGAIGNTVEATGHIAQGNKTTGQAVRDALSQTASDARTAASGALNAAGGMAAAKGVGILAGTVGSTTTNAVIQAAANNTAVVRILSGSAAGSAGALTSGVANTTLDVATGARPLDITAISKDLAFDATVGLLAGGLGGGAGAIKEGSSALTFGAVTTAEIGGDLAIGYGSAALRAKLEGREITFDEVTQEVASSVLGTTIGEMGGQHGVATAEAIRQAQDPTPETLATLAALTLPAAREGADTDVHSTPEADAGRQFHQDQSEEETATNATTEQPADEVSESASEETTTSSAPTEQQSEGTSENTLSEESATETQQNTTTDHPPSTEELRVIKDLTIFNGPTLKAGKALLTEEANGDLRVSNVAVLGSETTGSIYRRTADGKVREISFSEGKQTDKGIFNVTFDALAQHLKENASLGSRLSQEQYTNITADSPVLINLNQIYVASEFIEHCKTFGLSTESSTPYYGAVKEKILTLCLDVNERLIVNEL